MMLRLLVQSLSSYNEPRGRLYRVPYVQHSRATSYDYDYGVEILRLILRGSILGDETDTIGPRHVHKPIGMSRGCRARNIKG